MARRCGEGLAAAKTSPIWDRNTLKSDRGLNLGPRMTFNINKPIKNLVFLKVQLGKVMKSIVFLKVRTLNSDRGLSSEIAKRSNPIEISNSSKMRTGADPPDHPDSLDPGDGLQLATSPLHAPGSGSE